MSEHEQVVQCQNRHDIREQQDSVAQMVRGDMVDNLPQERHLVGAVVERHQRNTEDELVHVAAYQKVL